MKNPLPDILNDIPYTESVLDLELSDKLRAHVDKSFKATNAWVVSLLKYLANAGLIEYGEINHPTTPGTLVLIKRL